MALDAAAPSRIGLQAGTARILDRGFVVGFLFPSLIFTMLVSILFGVDIRPMLDSAGGGSPNTTASGTFGMSPWGAIMVLAGVMLFIGLLLLLINRFLIRLMSGRTWPLKNRSLSLTRWRLRAQLRRYRRAQTRLRALDLRCRLLMDTQSKVPGRLECERGRIWSNLVMEYPPEGKFLLPTRFGNIIRAFESYPLQVYGIDGVSGWVRLSAVLPKEFRQQAGDAKSLVDLALNSVVLAPIGVVLAAWQFAATRELPALGLMVTALAVVALSYSGMRGAARLWGELVKTGFDLYQERLAAEMGFALPANAEKRFEFWERFSQSMMYGIRFDPFDIAGLASSGAQDQAGHRRPD